jgi:hypothetical protein
VHTGTREFGMRPSSNDVVRDLSNRQSPVRGAASEWCSVRLSTSVAATGLRSITGCRHEAVGEEMAWAGCVIDDVSVDNRDVGICDVGVPSVGIRGTGKRQESLRALNTPVSSRTRCKTYEITDLCSVVHNSTRNNDLGEV